MQKFRTLGSTQRFVSTHATVYNTFNIRRHLANIETVVAWI